MLYNKKRRKAQNQKPRETSSQAFHDDFRKLRKKSAMAENKPERLEFQHRKCTR